MVMKSLQVGKEQIQLVISPDPVYQKKDWCSSDVPGIRDQIVTWGGKGKVNMMWIMGDISSFPV